MQAFNVISAHALNRTRDLENYEVWMSRKWHLISTEDHNSLRILEALDGCDMRLSVAVFDWLFPRNSPMEVHMRTNDYCS
jgi:hypothetical protein